MFSYIGESPNAVEGQSYKVFVRGDHGREVYKWSSHDDYQTGELSLSPLPVLTHPRVTQMTRSTILNSKWNIGTLVLHKRQLTNVPAGEAGVVRKMHLEIQAQPAYQITGFNLEGIPTLFQTTKIVTGTADRYKVPITLIREDSAVPFIPDLPDIFYNMPNRAVEAPIMATAREVMGAVRVQKLCSTGTSTALEPGFSPVQDEIDLTADQTDNDQSDSDPMSVQSSAPSTGTDAEATPISAETGSSSGVKRRNSGEVMGTPDSKQQRGEKQKPTKENMKKTGGENKKDPGGGSKTNKLKKAKSPSKNQTTLVTTADGILCLQPPAPVPEPPAARMTRSRTQRSASPESAGSAPTTPAPPLMPSPTTSATPAPSASAPSTLNTPVNSPATPKIEEPDIKQTDGNEELPGAMQNIKISTPRALRNSEDHEFEPILSRLLTATTLGDIIQQPASPDQKERDENLRRVTRANARVLQQRELGLKLAAIHGRALSSVPPRGILIKKEPAEDMSISSSSASERNMDTSELSSAGSRHVTFEDQVGDGNTSFDQPEVTYLPNPADHKESVKQEPTASIEEVQDNLEDSIKTTKRRGRVPVTVKTEAADQSSTDTSGTPGDTNSGAPGKTNTGGETQPAASTSGTGTGRPFLFDDLTISDTDGEEEASQPGVKTEEGDPEGEGDNGGARH